MLKYFSFGDKRIVLKDISCLLAINDDCTTVKRVTGCKKYFVRRLHCLCVGISVYI